MYVEVSFMQHSQELWQIMIEIYDIKTGKDWRNVDGKI